MNQKRPAGIICPIATPLNADETLDESALRTLLGRIIDDIDGVLVLGTTGEFALLKSDVARRTVEVTVEQVNGRKPIFAGVGDTGTRRVLEKLDFVADVGIDYAVVCSPYYYQVNDERVLLHHFEAVADKSQIPLLIYNIPQNTHINIPPKVIRSLSAHPNIVGLKDSWGDIRQFQEYLRFKGDSFSVFMGPEQLAAAALWLGADGIVSTLANFVPIWLQQLMQEVQDGKHQQALITQSKVSHLARIFEHGEVSSVIKVVLHYLGVCSERVASPLPPCSKEQKQAIHSLLEAASLV
jgi:4-hydroxy-tetrahydrodipicolinate synthase